MIEFQINGTSLIGPGLSIEVSTLLDPERRPCIKITHLLKMETTSSKLPSSEFAGRSTPILVGGTPAF